MNLKCLLLTLIICTSGTAGYCQFGNPNIDFELGNLSCWQYFTGSCCPIVTPTSTSPVVNRHTLTTGTAVDPYGLFPIVSPDGGSYSFRSGNDLAGSQAEKARYFIHVPSGISDYSLVYRYAVVFEDPGHLPSQQPRFEVKAYDSATNNPIPCAQFTYVADSTLPGFHKSLMGSDVYYKGWTSGNINLSGLGGTTITIDFATGDCALGAHFGYGYLDMTSGLFAISYAACDTDSVTLTAPAGFAYYSWTDTTTHTFVDSTKVVVVPNPPFPTVYRVIVAPYPGYGCPDTLFTKVFPTHLVVQPGGTRYFCPGSGSVLSVVATDLVLPLSYAWSPATGLGCTTCSTTTVSVTGAATYYVTVTDSAGCYKTDTFQVASAFSVVPFDTTLCQTGSVLLHPGVTGYAPPFMYSWAPSTGLSCITCANPLANPDVTTTYVLTVTDSAGCVITDTLQINRDNLSVSLGNGASLCTNSSTVLPLVVSGADSPYVCIWSPTTGLSCSHCANPVASPASNTTYAVSVTDINGCLAADSIKVLVDDLQIHPSGNFALCAGAQAQLTSGATGSDVPLVYSWSPGTGLSCAACSDPVASPTASTVYTFTVTDSNHCIKQAVVSVAIDSISLAPIPDTIICGGHPVTLYPDATTNQLPLTYSWSPTGWLSCANCLNPEATPGATTTYLLAVTDAFHCSVTTSVKIVVAPCDLFFPSAFTPNDDGRNDIIRVVGDLGFYRDFSLRIFNRWGQEVFYTRDIYSGWDGYFNGTKQDLGTYFYIINYSLYDVKHVMKGDFQLIR